jgi:hypothetical protein
MVPSRRLPLACPYKVKSKLIIFVIFNMIISDVMRQENPRLFYQGNKTIFNLDVVEGLSVKLNNNKKQVAVLLLTDRSGVGVKL